MGLVIFNICGLDLLRLGVSTSYVWGSYFSYVWGLVSFTFGG